MYLFTDPYLFQEAYKQWLCASALTYFVNGRPVRPCTSFCQQVEATCPFFRPKVDTHEGDPSFICKGKVNILHTRVGDPSFICATPSFICATPVLYVKVRWTFHTRGRATPVLYVRPQFYMRDPSFICKGKVDIWNTRARDPSFNCKGKVDILHTRATPVLYAKVRWTFYTRGRGTPVLYAKVRWTFYTRGWATPVLYARPQFYMQR